MQIVIILSKTIVSILQLTEHLLLIFDNSNVTNDNQTDQQH